VVVSAGPSGIRAYRAATGDPLWSMGGVVARLAAPNATSVFVVVPGSGGAGGDQLWNLDLASGKVRWRHDLGASVHGRFSATRDSVYVVDDLGGLHAVAVTDGHQRWTAQLAPPSCGTQSTCPDDPGGFRSQPNVTGNLVTVGDDSGFMRAFDTTDGTMRWQLATGSPVRSSPLVSHDVLFFANDDANLFAVNLATGKKEWLADTVAPVRSQPTVAYGVVYVTDTTGHVTAVVD
jgi:outer membrane protein assembly factor BamB